MGTTSPSDGAPALAPDGALCQDGRRVRLDAQHLERPGDRLLVQPLEGAARHLRGRAVAEPSGDAKTEHGRGAVVEERVDRPEQKRGPLDVGGRDERDLELEVRPVAGKRRDSLVPGSRRGCGAAAASRRRSTWNAAVPGSESRASMPSASRRSSARRAASGLGPPIPPRSTVTRNAEPARPGVHEAEDERRPVRLRRVCDRHEDERLRPAVRKGVEDLVEALAESHGPIVRPALLA